MGSIITNGAAISALQVLRNISGQMGAAQEEVSSGLRVKTAADNAAYWSISTTMRSDNMAMSAVRDALGLSAAVLDTTYAAVETSIDIMAQITAKLVAAQEQGVDKTKINEELDQFKQQLQSTMDSASFNGQNWLSWNSGEDSRDKQIVSSFIRSSDGNVSLGTISYEINTPPPRTDTNVQYFVDNGGSGEYGILSSEAFAVQAGSAINYVLILGSTAPASAVELVLSNATSSEELDDMISTVEAMTKQMVSVASQIGSMISRVEMQAEFALKLSDSLDSGIGRLVDADMNEASTRLKALQTQEQLAVQSLSMANSQPDSLLTLFRQ
ncbi:flagellin N-terminal helical domain-containing protein [Rhizobium rosettiformans]|uniref:flagellin N-terminal helical domain-containing protein n=1 Tax=Rhizobium rosettiformans TaxID=1368430 RepID=UPI002861D3A3|nr:flagellin [Rhizobium rosettiformans]MDR7028439.1 flagellin [Rhizobium rosettiformans]MDR7064279.1 flagellin [Rhizobium rosettiformans]